MFSEGFGSLLRVFRSQTPVPTALSSPGGELGTARTGSVDTEQETDVSVTEVGDTSPGGEVAHLPDSTPEDLAALEVP